MYDEETTVLRRYQLVVFDWEGTIVENGLGHLMNALTAAALRLHLPPFDEEHARQIIPYGLSNAVKKLFPTILLHKQEELCAEAQKLMLEASTSVSLVAGVEDAIRWIHAEGLHLGIATNKSAQSLARALRLSGLEPYIQITRSATEAPAKPCPQMLEEIMVSCGATVPQTLMVGDSTSDMEMAKALGVDVIGMDFFQIEEPTLRAAGALHVMHNYAQLLQYIKDN
jgi:phosphoglycolate phosphatase